MLRRFLSILSLSLSFFVFQYIPVYAQADTSLEDDQQYIEGQIDYHSDDVQKQTQAFTGTQGANFGRVRDPRDVVAQLIQAFLVLVGTVCFAYAVYAGYLILTSAGIEDRVERGKHILRNAVIGLAIILSAYALMWIVRKLFVASGNTAYEYCDPAPAEDFNNDPLSPQNTEHVPNNC